MTVVFTTVVFMTLVFTTVAAMPVRRAGHP